MNIFKNLTLTWWQGALFKWGVFLLGVSVGSYWNNDFNQYLPIIFIVSVILLAYISYVWWKE